MSHASTSDRHVATPWGPRRWAHSSCTCCMAASAAPASPRRRRARPPWPGPRPTTARRRAPRDRRAGRPPRRRRARRRCRTDDPSRSITASASPDSMALASRPTPPAKRCTVRSTTMPAPMPGAWVVRSATLGPIVVAAVAHDVAEHGAGLDRGQLLRIAHQHQAGGRTDGLDEPRHHRQRHHRRLVDDHDLVGELVAAVVAEAAVAARRPSEQPVDGRRLGGEQGVADLVVDVELPGPVVDRFGEPGRRLAGGGGRARPGPWCPERRPARGAGRGWPPPWWSSRCPGRRR